MSHRDNNAPHHGQMPQGQNYNMQPGYVQNYQNIQSNQYMSQNSQNRDQQQQQQQMYQQQNPNIYHSNGNFQQPQQNQYHQVNPGGFLQNSNINSQQYQNQQPIQSQRSARSRSDQNLEEQKSHRAPGQQNSGKSQHRSQQKVGSHQQQNMQHLQNADMQMQYNNQQMPNNGRPPIQNPQMMQKQYSGQNQQHNMPMGHENMPIINQNQMNQHSNRSNTGNTSKTHKSGRSNGGGQNKSHSKKSKRKTSNNDKYQEQPGKLPPPKFQIQQPNFNNKQGGDHSNSYSDYQEETFSEKAVNRNQQNQHQTDRSQSRQQNSQPQQQPQYTNPNPDSYRNESYSVIYQQNGQNQSNSDYIPQNNQFSNIQNSNQNQQNADFHNNNDINDQSIDSQAQRDLQLMQEWGFAESVNSHQNLRPSIPNADQNSNYNNKQSMAYNQQMPSDNAYQNQSVAQQQVNNSLGTNISSIHPGPIDNSYSQGQNPSPQIQQQNGANPNNRGGVQRVGGAPPPQPMGVGGMVQQNNYMGGDYNNQQQQQRLNNNPVYGNHSVQPGGQMAPAPDNNLGPNNNGEPLSMSQLEEYKEIDPITDFIQQESEGSISSGENMMNDTRHRQKKRMQKKYRGQYEEQKQQKKKNDRSNQNNPSKKKRKRDRKHSEKSSQSNEDDEIRSNRISNNDEESYESSSGESGTYSDDDDDLSSSNSNGLVFHDVADQGPNQGGQPNINYGQAMVGGGNSGMDPYSIVNNGNNMLNNGSKGSRESHLLPIQFAKEHIMKIEEDMKKMHERHVKLMREMDENYKLIEQETQEYYIEFLQKWKEVAKQKIQQYRKTTEELTKEKEKIVKDRDAQIQLLNEQKTQLLEEKKNLLKEYQESIMIRTDEIDQQKLEFDKMIAKKEQEIFNLKNINEQQEMQITQIQVQFKAESDQLRSQLQQLNQQNESLQNQQEINIDKIQQFQSQLQGSNKEFEKQVKNSDQLQNQIQKLEQLNETKVKELDDKIKAYFQQQQELRKTKEQMLELQRQVQQLQNQYGESQVTQTSVGSRLTAAAGQEAQDQSVNHDQGQISSRHQTENDYQSQMNQDANKLKVNYNQSKIRFPSQNKPNLQVNNTNIKEKFKIKGLSGLAQGNKMVVKPSSILQSNNQSFTANAKPLNFMKGVQMSEQEFESKKNQINQDYSKQQNDITAYITHYQNQVKTNSDDMILKKFEQDIELLANKKDEDLQNLQKKYDSAQKQQILVTNLNNRNLSNNSAKRTNYNTSVDNKSQGQAGSNNGQLSINLNKIKDQHKGENPYSSNDRGSIDGSQIQKQVPNQIINFKKLNAVKNDSVLSNFGSRENNINLKNFGSLNSAREPMSSKGPDIMDDRVVKELQDKVKQANFDNTQLKNRVSVLSIEVESKQQLEKELIDAKSTLLKLQDQPSLSPKQTQNSETDQKIVEKYQRQIEELKKQTQQKITEYNKNIQYAKTKIDNQKDAITKLKQLAQKNRDEKTVYEGKLESLETVNEEIKNKLNEVKQQTRQDFEMLQKQNKDMRDQFERLWIKFQNETVQRKKLHNVIEDMKGKIRVYCRVRPMNQKEVRMGFIDAIQIVDQFTLRIRVKKDQQLYKQNQIQSQSQTSMGVSKEYVFDACFDSKTSQEEIFEDTKMLIQSAIDGYNVCIFAYGQTGSGKTYTVTGQPDNMGIVPRSFMEMFSIRQKLEKDKHFTIKFECYMVEIYLDKLHDLLFGGQKTDKQSTFNQDKLNIREDPHSGMVYIQNVKQKSLDSFQDALDTFNVGLKSRKTNATEMNDQSSRSHLVFSVFIVSTNNKNGEISRSKISFVDLAGSERLSKSNPNTNIERLRESNAINLSLKSLGDVIQGLSNGNVSKAHIPYRDNKLTHLMKDSLGGNSKTLMFVNISPADYNSQESQFSLQFGDRVKMIQNEVTKNVESEQMNKLRLENELLRKRLEKQ